jgi:ribose/xylose/arabinose/galactoside ABC-type transport system permease subunit
MCGAVAAVAAVVAVATTTTHITNEMKNYEHFLFTAIVIACLSLVMPSS